MTEQGYEWCIGYVYDIRILNVDRISIMHKRSFHCVSLLLNIFYLLLSLYTHTHTLYLSQKNDVRMDKTRKKGQKRERVL